MTATPPAGQSPDQPPSRVGARDEARFWSKVDKSGECWLWQDYLSPKGYGRFRLGDRLVRAHRVAWHIAHGQPAPEDMMVLHSCPGGGNAHCVNPAHLRLGTHRDNMSDRQRHGRQSRPRGALSPSAKLTSEQVQQCFEQRTAGVSTKDIAATMGVHPSTVGRVLAGASWQPLPSTERARLEGAIRRVLDFYGWPDVHPLHQASDAETLVLLGELADALKESSDG